ncbi:MAG: hypothetical protein IJ005_00045 [Bacteroidales bacterium]|nr:hypothetical protein [Bacteroidales bacterium]
MKLVRILIAAAAFTAVLAGCKKDELTEGKKPSEGLTVNAAVDGTVVTAWTASDKMTVVVGEEMYEYVTTQSGANAAFTDKNGILTADMVGDNPVAAFVNCRSMFGAFNISPEQTYGNDASSVAIPMYAYTMNAPQNDALALQFNALASIINLAIAPYDITVQSLKIKAAEGATITSGALAGAFKVDADNGTISATSEQNELTVTFAGGLNLSQGATIRIPVGLCSVAGGLELTFSYDDVKEYVGTIFASDSAVKLYDDATGFKKAAKIDAAFEFDANAFPRTWYVAPDGTADEAGITAEAPTSLSNALSSALAGSVIKLAAGTYYPDTVYPGAEGDMFKTFAVTRNVTLEGADGAVLDGNGTSLHTMVVYAPKIEGEKIVLKNVTIKGGANTAADEANAIVLAENEDATFVNADGNYGAGLYIVNSTVDMDKVIVKENSGNNASGLFAKGSDLVITNSSFDDNVATGNGGGIWFSSGNNIRMEDCTVNGNSAVDAAGLYFVVGEDSSINATVTDVEMSGNTASGKGAGLYLRSATIGQTLNVTVDGCLIAENEAATQGSAINCLNASGMLIRNTEIRENEGGSKEGGILSSQDASATYRNCSFIDNSAFYNAVTLIKFGTNVFDGCVWRGNKNTAFGNIYILTSADDHGSSDVVFTNCLFDSNVVTGRGGAIYARATAAGGVNVKCVNTTFYKNEATSQGAAVVAYSNAKANTVDVDLISCTVAANTTTNAECFVVAAETVGANIDLYNTIVAGNENKNAGAKAGTMTFNCCFSGAEYYGADGAVATLTPAFDYSTMLGALNADGVCPLAGNDSTNPAFANGMAAADLQALAAGNVTADVLGSDQLGNARTGKVMGAYVK